MLQKSVDFFFNIFNLDMTNRWIQALNFFIYDSIKIILLLFVMIGIISYLRTYVSRKKIRKFIGQKYGIGYFAASSFGAITPFCSCSSIPIFLSILRSGVPLGVAMSFIVTSPLVNQYLVVLMLGFFGWKITLAYVISGILVGVISGFILGRLGLEKDISEIAARMRKEAVYNDQRHRLTFSLEEAKRITANLWVWILVGVGIGAVVHNIVPTEIVHNVVDSTGFMAVPLAVVLGVPMYGSCAGIIPVALILFNKGVPLGTALAFMMSFSALSFPEAVILKRVMKTRLIVVFFIIVAITIIFSGFVFNVLESWLV